MKNYKGGYKLIDLEKVDLVDGGAVKGIHKAIESSYAKPLLLTGIVIDGVEKNDVYIKELKVVDSSFVFKAYGYEITIDDEDNVDAVEVPVVKSVTSSAETKEIDIQDGDEYLLSSTNASETRFNFPNGCYLVGLLPPNDDGDLFGIVNGYNNKTNSVSVSVIKDGEVYVKRVGNMILLSYIGIGL